MGVLSKILLLNFIQHKIFCRKNSFKVGKKNKKTGKLSITRVFDFLSNLQHIQKAKSIIRGFLIP